MPRVSLAVLKEQSTPTRKGARTHNPSNCRGVERWGRFLFGGPPVFGNWLVAAKRS